MVVDRIARATAAAERERESSSGGARLYSAPFDSHRLLARINNNLRD